MHIWTSCNHEATGDNLTVGFRDEAGDVQITDMYIDNCRLIVQVSFTWCGWRASNTVSRHLLCRLSQPLAHEPECHCRFV